jgi:hypothetical protein
MSTVKIIVCTVILTLAYVLFWKAFGINFVLCLGIATIVISMGRIEEKLNNKTNE